MEWAAWARADAIAAIALLVAIWAAWTNHKTARRLDRQEWPSLSWTASQVKGHPEWMALHIMLTNNAPFSVAAKSLSVVKPAGGALILRSAVIDGTETWTIDETTLIPLDMANRTLAIGGFTSRAGTHSVHGGPSDTNHIHLLLHLPQAGRFEKLRGRRAVKMKMLLEGTDALSTPYHLTLLRSQKL